MNRPQQHPLPQEVERHPDRQCSQRYGNSPMANHSPLGQALMEFATHVGGAKVAPTPSTQIKNNALAAMEQQCQDKLDLIAQQVISLAQEAKKIQQRVEISQQIYNSEIGFTPVLGQCYHFYRRSNGQHLLSLISPEEWGQSGPFAEHLATVQLLADHTWKILQTETNHNP